MCLCEVAVYVPSFQTDIFTSCCWSSFTLISVVFLRFFSLLLCVGTAVLNWVGLCQCSGLQLPVFNNPVCLILVFAFMLHSEICLVLPVPKEMNA